MNHVNTLIDRVRVLASTMVTWLIALQVLVQYAISQEAVLAYPDVVQWGGQALALIGGIILVVRRVTPAEDKGILPT